jgi:hypothetical protein
MDGRLNAIIYEGYTIFYQLSCVSSYLVKVLTAYLIGSI